MNTSPKLVRGIKSHGEWPAQVLPRVGALVGIEMYMLVVIPRRRPLLWAFVGMLRGGRGRGGSAISSPSGGIRGFPLKYRARPPLLL